MTMRSMALWTAILILITTSPIVGQQAPRIGVPVAPLGSGPFILDTAEQHKIRVTVVARGLSHPWAIAFLPDGAMLVTERPGRLRVIRNGVVDPTPIRGVPEVRTDGNGGLMDVALNPRFAENRLVYLTYTKPVGGGKGAPALARGKLEGGALTDVRDLIVTEAYEGNSGLNGRVVFGRDGMLYMSTGGNIAKVAQDPNSLRGKILRLRDDGSVPGDNPFVGRAGYRPEIYTLGHRNTLGLIVHPLTGAIWNHENGPNGGDEINIILPGRNYAWPVMSFGRDYPGPRISEHPTREGFESPLVVWLPAIAAAGMAVYTGDRFPAWKGNAFVGSMTTGRIPGTGHLERIVFNDKMEELRRESMLSELRQRIREVREGPDGLLYLLTDEDEGALLRIEPAPNAVSQSRPPSEGPAAGDTPAWFLQGSFPDPGGRTVVEPGGRVTVARRGERGAAAAPATTPPCRRSPICGNRLGRQRQSLQRVQWKQTLGYTFTYPYVLPSGFGGVPSVALDSKDNLWVFQRADAGKPQLFKFDSNYELILQVGPEVIGYQDKAHGMAVDAEDNVWITATNSATVMKLSPEGKLLLTIGERGRRGDWDEAKGQRLLWQPVMVAFAPNGDVYIGEGHANESPNDTESDDPANNLGAARIIHIDKNGKFINQWFGNEVGPGKFYSAHGLAVDPTNGDVWIGDREEYRIVIYSGDGKFLKTLQMRNLVCALYFDSHGQPWMATGQDGQFLKLDRNGNVLAAIGNGMGIGTGQFIEASYWVMDKHDNLYAGDTSVARITKMVAPITK